MGDFGQIVGILKLGSVGSTETSDGYDRALESYLFSEYKCLDGITAVDIFLNEPLMAF